MTVKTGGTWSGLVVCKDATGALSAPSAGPAGTLYVDGTANGAGVTVTGANPYKWTVTLPALTAGQCVSMYITATIATIATASVVAEDTADTALNSDAVTLSATQPAITWAAQTITNNAGAALTLSSTGGNGAGLVVSGNGAGPGVDIDAGATGIGVDVDAAANMGVSIAGNITARGALDVLNSHANGHGQYNKGGTANNASGQKNDAQIGQFNMGTMVGQENNAATGSFGQYNVGGIGQENEGESSYGVYDIGAVAGLLAEGGTGPGIQVDSTSVTGQAAIAVQAYGNGAAVQLVASGGAGLQVTGTTADINADITGNLSGSVGSVTSYGTLVADIWSYTTRTLTSLSALVSSVAAAVWAYATRTLTQSAAAVTAALAGSTVTILRGDTVSIAFTALGNVTGYQAVWFTVKASPGVEADADSLIMAKTATGLVYLNGAAATTAGDASVTVTDATTGAVTVLLKAAATAALTPQAGLAYDVQWKDATGQIFTLTTGTANITADTTRAVA